MTSEYGRYRIVKELGKGTMGVVYQAHDPQIDRMVALKVLRPDRVTSEAFVNRFLKEARAIGRLSHPRIVTIYDVGEDHGTIYIAMEYLQGEPFNDVVRSGRLTLLQSVDIAKQVAETLDYAHRQGIVHRDIKPSNIILGEDNQVKLTDFGIARIEDTAAGHQTQAGEILGTPVYMSPEQVMGKTVDGRSDLFSVGVILYEMTVGRRPFSGNNIAAIFRAITQDEPEPPDRADPFVPKALTDVILKSLSKSPETRFQTGKAFSEALSAIQQLLKDGNAITAEQSAPSPPGKKKTGIVVGVLVLALLLIGGGYYFVGRTQQQTNTTTGTPAGNLPASTGTTGDGQTTPGMDTGASSQDVEQATLKITSEPEGARVFVDNDLKGQTPIDLPLPLGKYELRLSMDGFLEWEAQVELDVADVTPLHIAMRALE